PVFAMVGDSGRRLGYIVQWRRQFPSPQGRQAVKDLIGPEARLIIGDTTPRFWADLTPPESGPPRVVPTGPDIAPPPVTRYQRANAGGIFAAAARARNTPWVALVEFSDHVVFGPSQVFLKRLLAVCGGLIVIALGTAWWMSRNLTRPLGELA